MLLGGVLLAKECNLRGLSAGANMEFAQCYECRCTFNVYKYFCSVCVKASAPVRAHIACKVRGRLHKTRRF